MYFDHVLPLIFHLTTQVPPSKKEKVDKIKTVLQSYNPRCLGVKVNLGNKKPCPYTYSAGTQLSGIALAQCTGVPRPNPRYHRTHLKNK